MLAAAVILAGSAAPAERVEIRTLAIVTEFEHAPPRAIRNALQREVETLFHLRGLRIVWEDLSEAAAGSVHDHIVVARFRGSCAAESIRRTRRGTLTLAFTHVTDGEVLPFAEVDCERVRQVLSRVVRTDSGRESEMALGRALARVLGHEVYHVLTATMEHGVRGLAKPSLAPHELLADGFGFDDPDLVRIRRALFGGGYAVAAATRAPSVP